MISTLGFGAEDHRLCLSRAYSHIVEGEVSDKSVLLEEQRERLACEAERAGQKKMGRSE